MQELILCRNYASDMPAMYRDIAKLTCDAFDVYQKDCIDGVPLTTILAYVLKHGKGHIDPRVASDYLLNFKRY